MQTKIKSYRHEKHFMTHDDGGNSYAFGAWNVPTARARNLP